MARGSVVAVTMLSAVGMCLAVVGSVGAALAAWQLGGLALSGTWPTAAQIWHQEGLTGQLFVDFIAWLPQLLSAAILFHLFVAAVGAGLVWRRLWAWRGALALAIFWIVSAAAAWFVVRAALDDLAVGYPAHAAFARTSEVLASEVTVLSIALGAGLLLLLVHPAVRGQFSADS
jgi:hypothetical protein